MDTRRQVRWADRVHQGLNQHSQSRLASLDEQIGRLAAQLEQLARLRAHLNVCQKHHWNAAAESVLGDLLYQARDIWQEAERIEPLIRRIKGRTSIPLGSIVDELSQLEQEFEDLRFQRASQTLCVTTKPIVLQDIRLGRFEIRLELDQMHHGEHECPLRIIALEPNPAAGNDSVCHPHVKEQRLCAGDALTPMLEAINNGRICDLFLMARSVLEAYNEESPYISLENWDGALCADCGDSISSDESCYCDGCSNDYCEGCIRYCHGCDTSLCGGCLSRCDGCRASRCKSCLTTCDGCSEEFCGNCLKEDLCTSCQEKENDDSGQHENSASAEECGGITIETTVETTIDPAEPITAQVAA